MARHRRQGHIPFNPNCLECAKGRSVFQHRRDRGDRKEVSIQADFAFLSTKGEVVADELPGSVKILVLVEVMSRCIGYEELYVNSLGTLLVVTPSPFVVRSHSNIAQLEGLRELSEN